jgi:hypothetical protein
VDFRFPTDQLARIPVFQEVCGFLAVVKQYPQGLKYANSDVPLQIVGGEMQPSREREAAFG